MKKTVSMALVCVFFSASIPAAAGDDWKDACATFSEISESVMKARQKGAAMSYLIKVGDGNKVFERMVIAAYEKPRYSSAAMQQRTIEEFRDDMFVQCAKDMHR